MKHIQSVTGDLDVCVTDDGVVAVMVEDPESYAYTVVKVPDIGKLIDALRLGAVVATDIQQQAIERTYGGRCQVNLIHQDKSESQCVLPKRHLLDDSDHMDDHGHVAPVLVRQSTIREVQAVQDARDAELDRRQIVEAAVAAEEDEAYTAIMRDLHARRDDS